MRQVNVRSLRRELKIDADPSHPGNRLFRTLPSGQRLRSIKTKTSHHKSSFFPTACVYKDPEIAPVKRHAYDVIIKANPKGWMDEEKMSEWLREIYARRLDGFFHKSPSLLICDSMDAHLTNAVKNQVKQTNSELAIIPGGLTKELQPRDIGVNRAFKVEL
ncbi:hypothetical protein DPEC_G00085960 [Dallia pectoralis]|uniref:Uncharacterized protein n=1 Tax=Dallia pectoralis TaxID=75939 RepID=A0ACC2H0D6_DALPE|nr:hypothetical protein DPEC_G00085960 [Dallia pectoralis]